MFFQDKSNEEEEPAVTDNRALDTLLDEKSPENTVAVAEPVLGTSIMVIEFVNNIGD